MKVQKI